MKKVYIDVLDLLRIFVVVILFSQVQNREIEMSVENEHLRAKAAWKLERKRRNLERTAQKRQHRDCFWTWPFGHVTECSITKFFPIRVRVQYSRKFLYLGANVAATSNDF
jgi:hypothetical protein